MKALYFTTILSFWGLFMSPLQGQDHLFEAGKIITQYDTLTGFIKRSTDLNLTQSIEFKISFESTVVKIFTPKNALAFSFDADNIFYKKVQIRYLNNEMPFSEWRFGRMILKGETSVYKLRLGDFDKRIIIDQAAKDLYVVQKKDTFYTLEIREALVSKVEVNISSMNGENFYNLKKPYLPVLEHLTRDCPSISRKAKGVDFNEKAIIDFFNDYNKCLNPSVKTEILSKKSKISIAQGIEFSTSVASKIKSLEGGYFLDIREPHISERIHGILGFNLKHLAKSGENVTAVALRVVGNHDLVFEKNQKLYFGFGYEYLNFIGTRSILEDISGLYTLNLGYSNRNMRIEFAPEFFNLFLGLGEKILIYNLRAAIFLKKNKAAHN
jgi:hypothetical protein